MELNVQTGLRDERHVIFDGGKRLAWFTTFETDWDPYVEDAFMRIGIDNFTDWMQHLTSADQWFAGIREAGGEEKLPGCDKHNWHRAGEGGAGGPLLAQEVSCRTTRSRRPGTTTRSPI